MSSPSHHRFARAACVAALVASVVPQAATPASADDGAPVRVSLRVATEGPIRRGDVVRLDVVADGPETWSAFEVTATAAGRAARIVGADTHGHANPEHRDMSIADLGGVATLAGYSMSVHSGEVVGSFDVKVRRAGHIEVELGALEVAASDGAVVPSQIGDARVTLDVSTKRLKPRSATFPAPPTPWDFSVDGSRPTRVVPEVELEWQERRVKGHPCATTSARRAGGCLTVADVQRQEAAETLAPSTNIVARSGMTFVVRSRGDEPDAKVGNSVCATAAGTCTLRAAIQEANALSGPDTITFDLGGSAPFRIQLTDRLPGLWSGGTTIDGYTQPGASQNTSPNRFNGNVLVEIVGAGSNAFDGLVVTSGGNTIRGLSIHTMRRAIWIYRAGRAAAPNVIRGNIIGTNPSGTVSASAAADLAHGIHIEQDSANTIVGGPLPAQRNVISGNARHGVGIWHMWSDNTIVQGNLIGLAPDGTPLPNWVHGVDMNFGASNTLVGGPDPGDGNVISSNRGSAIEISHTADTTHNQVIGNIMGADVTGSAGGPEYGSGDVGIRVEDGVLNNTIKSNVIVNSAKGGIRITNVGFNGKTLGTVIADNWIGVSRDGVALPNRQLGLALDGSDTTVGPGNRIERNLGPGVTVSELDAAGNTITRNRIANNSGLAIDIAPIGSSNIDDAGDADTGPNGLLNAPVLTGVTGSTIRGRACAGCQVEIFTTGSTTRGHGPLDRYVTTLLADSNGAIQGANDSIALGSWVTATATDPAGNTSEASWNVLAAATNTQPTVDAGSDRTVGEGSTITLTATGQDADGDGLRYAWDLDDDGTFEALGRSVSYRVPRIAPATVTVRVEVVDDRGGSDRDSATMTIVDAPDPLYPAVGRVSAPTDVAEGRRIPLSISNVRDPDSPTTAVAIAFDCGGGFGGWGSSTSISCAGRGVGLATLGVRLRDDEGSVTTYPVRVIVQDNRLSNSSFEDGATTATNWTHPSTLARTTSTAHEGSASIATTTGTTAVLAQAFDIAPTRFAASGWVQINGTGSVDFRVRWYDGAGTLISTTSIGSRNGDTGGWVQIARTLDAPGAARRAKVEFGIQSSSGSRVAVDDTAFTFGTLLSQGGLDNDGDGDGRPDGWWPLTRFSSATDVVFSGARSGRAESDGTSFSPGQAFGRVTAGATYHVSGWVNVPADSDVTVRLSVRWRRSDGTTIAVAEAPSLQGSTPGWLQTGASLVAPSGATQANLEVRLVGLRGVMYLDQFVLARAS